MVWRGAGELGVLTKGMGRPGGKEASAVSVNEQTVWHMELRPGINRQLRRALDPDFARESITDEPAYRKFALRSHIVKDMKPLKMPANLLKSCHIVFKTADGDTVYPVSSNHKHILWIPIPDSVSALELRDVQAWNSCETRVFSCDVLPGESD